MGVGKIMAATVQKLRETATERAERHRNPELTRQAEDSHHFASAQTERSKAPCRRKLIETRAPQPHPRNTNCDHRSATGEPRCSRACPNPNAGTRPIR